ncbi:EF-P lysine aminoacylase EpmA [Thiorhodospira sibirica]|uniref:EF-P lysine aminoacylase EpmA n=1 Tax=Thiorhodospira sibirica TaxID=154347 RepID=UPI00022C0B71|nr:EF-P lysine aminoacylase EpmA [Thiorhodospira sibirica]
MADNAWQPSAAFAVLQRRAALLAQIRAFFAQRQVLEVETPVLSAAANPDPALESLTVPTPEGLRYLQTSPEFAMKRLLCAGYGDMYQLARVFRGAEQGRYHNPEFTLLEWYRRDFDHHRLMDEVEDLINDLADLPFTARAERIPYRDLFIQHLHLDPWDCTPQDCAACAQHHDLTLHGTLALDAWLDLLISHLIAPRLPKDRLCFVYDYPPSQAALAQIVSVDGRSVAQRFELYWGPLELANGFHELGQADEQQRRFVADNARRIQVKQPEVALDELLLAALAHGLPRCAGVALGIDRLLMCLSKATHIHQVLAFDWQRA